MLPKVFGDFTLQNRNNIYKTVPLNRVFYFKITECNGENKS